MALCCGKSSSDDSDAVDAAKGTGAFVPKSKRKCRDVLCCFLFLAYWVGMAIIAILSAKTGQPLRLVYGRDYAGNVCGDGALAGATFTAYPRLDEDLMDGLTAGLSPTEIKFFGVCVSSCPMQGDQVCTYDNSTCWTSAQDTSIVLFRCLPVESSNEIIIAEECLDPVGADPACTAEAYMSGDCAEVCHSKRVEKEVWEVAATTPNPLVEQLQGHIQILGRLLGDMAAAKWLVLAIGGVGALALGVVWLIALQFFAGCMVWVTCALVLVVLIIMSLFCSVRGGLISSSQLSSLSFLAENNATSAAIASVTSSSSTTTSTLQFKVAGYLLWALTIIVFLLLIAMHKRIKIAVAVIRESSRAIRKMPLLLLWPIIPTVFFITLVVYSIAIAACILSSDDLLGAAASTLSSIDESTTVDLNATQSVPPKTAQQAILAFHVFGFLWTNQLIQAISICAIAGSVAQYYWTSPDERGRRKMDARFPVARAVWHTLRFSLGSLCFGSFIIAFVQFLRLVLEYIDHNTKELQKSNRVVKVAFMAIKCCLWCFEKCLKFLSKNAYIVISMKGTSFCSASVSAFKLLLNNLARVAVVNTISFFLLLLAKLTITLTAGVAVFAAIAHSQDANSPLGILGGQPVTSPMAPVLATGILAWLVSSAFMNVYDTAIDTILLCFCEDSHLTGGAASEFMSEELRRIMGAPAGGKRTVIHVAPATSPGTAKAENETDI